METASVKAERTGVLRHAFTNHSWRNRPPLESGDEAAFRGADRSRLRIFANSVCRDILQFREAIAGDKSFRSLLLDREKGAS